jgi:hypothetical protein
MGRCQVGLGGWGWGWGGGWVGAGSCAGGDLGSREGECGRRVGEDARVLSGRCGFLQGWVLATVQGTNEA